MKEKIKKVVVVGGGTAGWISAALLKRVLGAQVDIELVESEQIGIIGVGEATIPPIRHINSVLELDEAEFLRETKATIKIAIKFENWRVQGESYYHTFGTPGKSQAFCHFHHFWTRAQQAGFDSNLWDYDLNYLCSEAGKFAKMQVNDPMWELNYAYHFDASLYGQFLRKYSEKRGVKRTEGLIEQVNVNTESGHVESLVLKSGDVVNGDFFVDCSGIRGLLIQQQLDVGYEDWSHWLPCDRAMAVPTERFKDTLPYTRSIAHSAGWQWRIPLQHRNGNGLVYSSSHYSDDEAANILLNNLDSPTIGEPKIIPFKPGRARKQWSKNVVAVGLSSGFLEPLESTSIFLIQSAVVRLIHLFPHAGVTDALIEEYNRQSQTEYELVRDFIILHYYLNEREDSQFWRDARNMEVPDRLTQKIELFRANGGLFQDQLDIFLEPSWLQVMLGQGVMPQDYHPIADSLTDEQLKDKLARTKQYAMDPLAKIPSHDEFLKLFCKST
ncbi:MAG: tryptophan halogenase [Xanthomonadales bacterium]|nr:tryptophan halogenase [Xanthomonadales bacterium]